MNFLTVEVRVPDAGEVTLTEDTLTVELADGRTISVPLAWYPRLVHAAAAERCNWQLLGGGQGIHWPRPRRGHQRRRGFLQADLPPRVKTPSSAGSMPNGQAEASPSMNYAPRIKQINCATEG